MNAMQTNKTLIFDKNADNIFKKGDYVNSYMVIDLKSVNLDFQIEEQSTKYNLIATLTDTDNNPIPNNIIEFYKTINDDNCVIDFESDKESVRNNQICILTATVTQNNNPLENILVQFYNDDILVGESITNENGQALFEYIGYGTDDVIITAKSDDIISNSVNLGNYSDVTKNIKLDNTNNIVQIDDMLVLTAHILDEYQQPYENLSVSFIQKNKQLLYDKGISTNFSNIWSQVNNGTLTRESTHSEFTQTSGSFASLIFNINYSPFIIEFDIKANHTGWLGTVRNNGTIRGGFALSDLSLSANEWHHIKISYDGTDIVCSNTENSTVKRNTNVDTFNSFQLNARNSTSIQYKNFKVWSDEKVYPVGDSIFVDKAVTGEKNTHWNDTNVSISVGSDGTLVSNSTGSGGSYAVLHPNTTTTPRYDYSFSSPLAIEFDIVSASDYTKANFQIADSNNHIALNKSLSDMGCVSTNTHMKIIVTDAQVLVYTENYACFYYSHSMDTNFRINFGLSSGYDFKFKNFKIYETVEFSTTNSNGIATCKLIGDGNGLKQYSAKTENIESEPLEVIDGIFYDRASISNNRNWTTVSPNMNLTRNTDYTTLKRIDNPTGFGWLGLQLPLTDHFAVEFDAQMTATNNETLITFRVSGGTVRLAISKNWAWSDGNWHHTKLEINGTTVKATVDGVAKSDLTLSGDITVLQFEARNDSVFNFKNFVVYPIESEEEIIYENSTEVTKTNKSSSTIYDNNMSIQLPTNAEITFDIYSTNSTSGSEHRFFLLPKSQYSSGTTQPTEALFIDLLSSSKAQIGKRESNSTYHFVQNISATSSTYHTVKIVKTGTSIAFYLDNTLLTTQTVSWIDNHSDYCLSMMRWSASGTSSIKNVIIKKYNN